MDTRHTVRGSGVTATPTLDSRRLERVVGTTAIRLAAVSGAIFFGLLVAYASLTSNAPSATDSRTEILNYVTDRHGDLQLAAVLLALAMPAALLWASGLFAVLRRAEGGTPGLSSIVAMGGAILAAAGTVMQALVLGTIANRVPDLGLAGTRVWWTMWLLSIGAPLLGLLLVIGATAVVNRERQVFGAWLTWVSAVLALVSIVGAWTIGFATAGIQIVAALAAVFDAVWILLVSVSMWRHAGVAFGHGRAAMGATGAR